MRMPQRYLLSCLLAVLLPALPLAPAQAESPDLVLLVVVDQLRGDMPWHYRNRFGPGGFRLMLDHGVVYRDARYQHGHTVTAAGHATLMTGGNAAQHGIAANYWFDRASRQSVYCMEDLESPLLGEAGPGRSPRNLEVSTVADELVRASGGRSRVFAVSIKDRAAIIMAGRYGKAWWFSKQSGHFITSSWYGTDYPEWVIRWNAADPADRFAGAEWTLSRDPSEYVLAGQDDKPWELDYGTLGRTFPHPLPDAAGPALYDQLAYTPMGDELTLDFVRALLAAEQPGQRGATDLLAVSFSVTDYVGHTFGPDSLEAEDNLLRVDRSLARLFALVDESVGLEHTLIVLASDHGSGPVPERMLASRYPAGRHRPAEFMRHVNDALRARFGVDEDLAPVFVNPGIYLDSDSISRLGLDQPLVEQAVAQAILEWPGFRLALTRSDLSAGRLPDTPEALREAASFYPARSGDVILVPQPFWYLATDPDSDAAMHGTPYAYDTHVPLMLAGPGIDPQVVYREVAPRDLAGSLSLYLGIPLPSGSVGRPLVEVLSGRDEQGDFEETSPTEAAFEVN